MKRRFRARLCGWVLICGSVPVLLGGSSAQAAGTLVASLDGTRARVETLLRRQGIFDPARKTVHLSHVCTLRLRQASMAVLDLREIVLGAAVPRGHNRILIMDGAGKVSAQIPYASERPLTCRGDKLLLQGNLAVDNRMPEGNVLSFDRKGRLVSVEQVDAQSLWPAE